MAAAGEEEEGKFARWLVIRQQQLNFSPSSSPSLTTNHSLCRVQDAAHQPDAHGSGMKG